MNIEQNEQHGLEPNKRGLRAELGESQVFRLDQLPPEVRTLRMDTFSDERDIGAYEEHALRETRMASGTGPQSAAKTESDQPTLKVDHRPHEVLLGVNRTDQKTARFAKGTGSQVSPAARLETPTLTFRNQEATVSIAAVEDQLNNYQVSVEKTADPYSFSHVHTADDLLDRLANFINLNKTVGSSGSRATNFTDEDIHAYVDLIVGAKNFRNKNPDRKVAKELYVRLPNTLGLREAAMRSFSSTLADYIGCERQVASLEEAREVYDTIVDQLGALTLNREQMQYLITTFGLKEKQGEHLNFIGDGSPNVCAETNATVKLQVGHVVAEFQIILFPNTGKIGVAAADHLARRIVVPGLA